jgi:hypothetical protein
MRPAAYGDAEAKAMRLLANADGSDGPGGGRRWNDHDRHQEGQSPTGPAVVIPRDEHLHRTGLRVSVRSAAHHPDRVMTTAAEPP